MERRRRIRKKVNLPPMQMYTISEADEVDRFEAECFEEVVEEDIREEASPLVDVEA